MLLLGVLLLNHWLCIARAQMRSFPVENCSACSTHDTTRGNIEMAKCDETNATNGSSVCLCRDFPANASIHPILVYYPQVTENDTTCTNDWAIAPHLMVGFRLLAFGLHLYALVHMVYTMWLTGLFSCQRNKCTTIDMCMLCSAVIVARFGIVHLLEIAAAFTIGSGYTYSFVGAFYIFDSLFSIPWDLYLILLFISVFDTAFSRDELVRLRCFVKIILWTTMVATVLVDFAKVWIYFFQYTIDVRRTTLYILHVAVAVLRGGLLYCSIFVVLFVVHCKMRKVRDYICAVLEPHAHHHSHSYRTYHSATPPTYAPPLGCVPVFDIGSQTPACRQSGGPNCCHVLLFASCLFGRFRKFFRNLHV